jgi:hypothetical protein
MWPFKKSKATPPADISGGDMTAHYDELLEYWEFQWAGFDFHIRGIPFNQDAFGWAREVAPVIRKLEPNIHARVMECLQDWPCDKTKAEVLCVDLDDYGKSKTIDMAFAGDDSWGDYGVNVIITDGKIEDAYGGD